MFRLILFTCCSVFVLCAQELPTDYLTPEFHAERRAAVRKQMPPNSVAVFFANPIRNRSNDVDYRYHQDPNFYYLTGFKEPHAMLLLYKNPIEIDGFQMDEILFVQERNAERERWDGSRLGVEGVKTQLGIVHAYFNTAFESFTTQFDRFDKVLFFDFQNDVRDHASNDVDLHALMQSFKKKTKTAHLDSSTLGDIMNDLREIKQPEELVLLKKAINISAVGQIEVMKAMHPNMSELEIQGIHEFVYKKYGAEYEGYTSIVGSGHNGCILHYNQSIKPRVGSDLVLMDLGAEYHSYTADITRTIPANGIFSKAQRAIYDIVFEAQKAGVAAAVVGANMHAPHRAALAEIEKGLKTLGIIKDENEARRYFPHGTSHYLGLDVHDAGTYNSLRHNSLITVEPGIYIPDNSPCDPKWWGIAIRIEDDILITNDGPINLSASVPRSAAAIEAMMQQPSALDDFILPELGTLE